MEGQCPDLGFASDDVALQKTNMIAANGRIKDVDIATEHEPGEISGTRSGIRIDARTGQYQLGYRPHAAQIKQP